ncbi:MAG: hypothetical protein ACK5SI_10010 [Planctomycetia bacterium]|jgi:hypothetical protein
MISPSNGLLASTARPVPAHSDDSERERLRQELLRRIIVRESLRQSKRGAAK